MLGSQWHQFYASTIAARPELLFGLPPDRPNYGRWLVLDFAMPMVLRPLRPAITARFNQENLRTMAAVEHYAEAQADDGVPS